MTCVHRWHLPSPEPGAEYLEQTCRLCGATKSVPAFESYQPFHIRKGKQ